MRWGPHRRLNLKAMMRRSVRLASRPGLWWGRLERSSMGWPARYRPTHRLTVAGETWKRSAARHMDHAFFHHQTGKTTAPLKGS